MDGGGLRLLVVDDDAVTRRALARTLKPLGGDGCVVSESGDGVEARALLIDERYDCAFLDYRMPGQDGLAVLRGVRAAGVQTPIVILTGEGSEELAVEMMKAGASDYLVKGRVTPELLGHTLRNAIRLREAEARAAAAQARHRESEERFKRLVEVAEDGVWILGADGRTTFVNAGAAAMIGYRPEEILGRSPLDFVDESSKASTIEGFKRRRQGFRERRECLMRHRDGSPVWTIVAAAPLTGPDGEYRGSFAVLTDVTREKLTEQALRASEARFRSLFESSPLAISLSVGEITLYANPAYLRMFGYDRADEVVGHPLTERVAPAFRREVMGRLARQESGGAAQDAYEAVGLRRDGSEFPCHVSVTLMQVPEGVANLAFITDLTGQKDAEAGLRASEERFRRLFEASPVGIAVSVMGIILYANPAYVRMFGYDDPAEVCGRPILNQFAPAGREAAEDRRLRRYRGEAVPTSYEGQGVRRDGTEFPFHIRIGELELPEGPAYLVFMTDLSEQKQAEAALTETSRTLEAVFAASPLAISVLDRNGIVRMWNPAAERMFGWTAQDAVGQLFPLLAPSNGPGQLDGLYRRLFGGQPFEGFEGPQRRKDGTTIDVSISAAPLEADGDVTGIVVVCADVTEPNRLRDQLAQSQKMESLGRLAGGISHDFNNLLAVISGYGESLRRRIPEGHPGRPQVEEIERAAERGARLVKQLLAFSRSQPVRTERVDLTGVVSGVCEMLRQVIGKKVTIERHSDGHPAVVDADPGQMEQMLVNLALNARDAMPDGGTLTISIRHISVPAVPGSHPDSGFVLLIVTDTGSGMDASTQSRMFEPFFTTKGDGTGLGLAIVYGIVRQQGGHISVHSEPGRGTRFEILVPAAAASAKPAP